MKYRYDKHQKTIVEKPETKPPLIEPLPVPQLHGQQALAMIEELKREMIYGR